MVQKQTLDETVTRSREEKLKWVKRLQMFTMKDGKLLWDGKQVPTVDEFDCVGRPIHVNEKSDHGTHSRKTLRGSSTAEFISGKLSRWIRTSLFIVCCHAFFKLVGFVVAFLNFYFLYFDRREKPLMEIFRVIHDCGECFWRLHKENQWQRASIVSLDKRLELRRKLKLEFIELEEKHTGSSVYGLGEPALTSCRVNPAKGRVACWFSSLFYLFIGQNSI